MRSDVGRYLTVGLAAFSLSIAGCQGRDGRWDTEVGPVEPVGLAGSVALRDSGLNRLVFLTSDKVRSVETTAFGVGLNVTSVTPSADLSRLFVLSKGVFPRIEEDDEPPQLLVFDGGTEPKLERRFELDDPMTRLSLDPRGEWVAAYAGDATVTNPNELVLLSLDDDSETPVSKTIRSFGGAPEELIFTDELKVPRGGDRRFVIVRTDRDITLIDLANLEESEVTVRLPEMENGGIFEPAQVVYDDGDPDEDDDARIAVSLAGSSDVVLLQLGRSESQSRDFSIVVNIVDVGGVPATIDFVRTDGGLRLAALVPSTQKAALVNPETTLVEFIDLPFPYNRMTRITSAVSAAPESGDVALLYGAGSQIAFWSLGQTSATPYRSVDATELPLSISKVIDVPSPNEHLKVLEGTGSTGFFVLDLKKRQSFPLNTRGSGFSVKASSDGERLWVSQPGGYEFSAVTLSNLHPAALYVTPGVDGIFDIERADGGRSAIALHNRQGWAATVLDANRPNSAQTAYFPGLHLEGLQ